MQVLLLTPDLGYEGFEKYIESELHQFLEKYFPGNDKLRSVQFHSGVWKSKELYGSGSIKTIFNVLKSLNVLIIELRAYGKYFDLSIAYWGAGYSENFTYRTVISHFPYKEFIQNKAESRTQAIRDLLSRPENTGINYNLQDYNHNLSILEQRDTLSQSLQRRENNNLIQSLVEEIGSYHTNSTDIDSLYKLISNYYCLITGWIVDIHFMLQSKVQPLLPVILPSLEKEIKVEGDMGSWQKLAKEVPSSYMDISELYLEYGDTEGLPELNLGIASSLSEHSFYSLEYLLGFITLSIDSCFQVGIVNTTEVENLKQVVVFDNEEEFKNTNPFVVNNVPSSESLGLLDKVKILLNRNSEKIKNTTDRNITTQYEEIVNKIEVLETYKLQVIPRITANSARSSIEEYVYGESWVTPLDYGENVNILNFHSYYLPCWFVNCTVKVDYIGQRGTIVRTSSSSSTTSDDDEISWEKVSDSFEYSFSNNRFVFSANTLVAENIIKSLYISSPDSPYLIHKGEFHKGVQVLDMNVPTDQINKLFKDSLIDSLRPIIGKRIDGDTNKVDNISISYAKILIQPIYFPIFHSEYIYNDKSYSVYINGVSKKLTGQKPWSIISLGKRLWKFGQGLVGGGDQ